MGDISAFEDQYIKQQMKNTFENMKIIFQSLKNNGSTPKLIGDLRKLRERYSGFEKIINRRKMIKDIHVKRHPGNVITASGDIYKFSECRDYRIIKNNTNSSEVVLSPINTSNNQTLYENNAPPESVYQNGHDKRIKSLSQKGHESEAAEINKESETGISDLDYNDILQDLYSEQE